MWIKQPIGSLYGIYANIGGILMVNVTIYSIHGSYGQCHQTSQICHFYRWYVYHSQSWVAYGIVLPTLNTFKWGEHSINGVTY